MSVHRPAVNEEDVRSFAVIYRKAKEAGLAVAMPDGKMRLGPDIGHERPFFPVFQPPRIMKAWVPAHVMPDDDTVMVAGHWAFIMVEAPHWYVKEE